MKLLLLISVILANPNDQFISLPFQGATLQGRLRDNIRSFQGIPFAQPPIGPNRFKPPIPIRNLQGQINATEFGKSCLQQASSPFFTIPDQDTSEDCLNINVYTPVNRLNLPVMVWVYGGSFSSGSAAESRYDGSLILKNNMDFCFVSFNYRTGVMGFMGSPSLAQEGSINAGLLDQKLAFEWVRANIQQFGCDPNQVTAVGESAGGISIGALLLMNNGQERLFDRAMLISGAPGLFHPAPQRFQGNFDRVSQKAGCGTGNSPQVLDCLRRVDALRLRDAGNEYGQYEPIFDERMVPQSITALQNNAFMKVPLLIHLNEDEGTFFALGVFTETQARDFIARQVGFLSPALINQAQQLYLSNTTDSSFQNAAKFQADQIFNCASLQTARFYKLQAPVFKVMNKHVNALTSIVNVVRDMGVYHTSELPHLFQDTRFIANSEQAFSRRLQSQYLAFVKTGNPGFTNYNNEQRFDIANGQMEPDNDLNEKCAFLIDTTNQAIEAQNQEIRPSPTAPGIPTSAPTIVVTIPTSPQNPQSPSNRIPGAPAATQAPRIDIPAVGNPYSMTTLPISTPTGVSISSALSASFCILPLFLLI